MTIAKKFKPTMTGKRWDWPSYKKIKRRQVRDVLRAMEPLMDGCAWLPVVEGVYVGSIRQDLKRLLHSMATRRWRNDDFRTEARKQSDGR